MPPDPSDTDILDWLERNLLHLSHNRASSSVDMGGINVRGQLHNEARARASAKPLVYSPELALEAEKHSKYQAKRGGECFHSKDILQGNLREKSENVFWGSNGKVWTQADAHESWWDSIGHRRNLLDSKWERVGFGMAVGRNGYYYTALFSR